MPELTIPLQYVVAFSLSALTSYIDISTFFQQKSKFRVSPLSFTPSILFFLFNGLLAVLMMYVIVTNNLMPNSWTVAFLSGLGTAGLLRSKFFTFGEKNIEAGFEYIYNFLKNETVSKLARYSGLRKIELSVEIANQHRGIPNVGVKYDQASQEISKSADWDSDKKDKFLHEYTAVKNDQSYTTVEDRLAALIRVFIDYSDLEFTRKMLRSFLGK